MTIRSILSVSALALTCAVSSNAFAKTAVCADLAGTYEFSSGGKVVDAMTLSTTGCDSLAITYSDGTTDVLATEGNAEVLQTAANGRALESIAYYVDTAAGAGNALRVTRYIVDPVGTLSVALIISLQLDASKNLIITSSAVSATDPASTQTDTWTPATTPTPPVAPGTFGTSKLKKYFSKRM